MGNTKFDHVGAPDAPDINGRDAVAMPLKMAIADAVEYTIPPLLAVKFAAVPPFARDTCPVKFEAANAPDNVVADIVPAPDMPPEFVNLIAFALELAIPIACDVAPAKYI